MKNLRSIEHGNWKYSYRKIGKDLYEVTPSGFEVSGNNKTFTHEGNLDLLRETFYAVVDAEENLIRINSK